MTTRLSGRSAPRQGLSDRQSVADKDAKRRAARRSSWRYIPMLTAGCGALFLVALLVAPAPKPDVAAKTPANIAAATAATADHSDKQIAAIMAELKSHEGNDPASADAPQPAWVRIIQPVPMYAVEGDGSAKPPLDGLGLRYAAARHSTGGGRDDVLTYGSFNAEAPMLRISVYQAGREAPPPSRFFVDLARRAGEAGLAVEKSAVATPLATKFGSVETADAILSRAGRQRACLAFRMNRSAPELRVSGWYCGAAREPAARTSLACALDGLSLRPGAGSPDLARLFTDADEHAARGCTGKDGSDRIAANDGVDRSMTTSALAEQNAR